MNAVNCPSSPLTKPLQVISFQKHLYEKYIYCVKQLCISIKTKFILLISGDFVGIESLNKNKVTVSIPLKYISRIAILEFSDIEKKDQGIAFFFLI